MQATNPSLSDIDASQEHDRNPQPSTVTDSLHVQATLQNQFDLRGTTKKAHIQ